MIAVEYQGLHFNEADLAELTKLIEAAKVALDFKPGKIVTVGSTVNAAKRLVLDRNQVIEAANTLENSSGDFLAVLNPSGRVSVWHKNLYTPTDDTKFTVTQRN